MKATIYASFKDVAMAEKATGALIDNGLAPEDVSLVANQAQERVVEPAHVEYDETKLGYEDPVDPDFHEVTGTSYGHAIVNDMGYPQTANAPFSTPGNVGYGTTMAGGIEASDPLTHHLEGHRAIEEDGPAPTIDNEPVVAQQTYTPPVIERDEVVDRPQLSAKGGISTTTPADAGAGAVKGATIGLGVGIAAALAAVFLPGIGLIAGGGAMAAALAGAVGTTGAGAVAGGVFGYLKDQGVPEEALTVYREVYDSGGAVLAVNIPVDFNRADIEAILAKYNAQNIELYGGVR